MGDFAFIINDLINAQEANSGENNWIKEKLADVKDRSRQNNVKI